MVDFGGTIIVILGLCKIGDTPQVCLGKMSIMAIFAGFITSVWGLAKVYKVVVYKPFDYTYLCIYHKPMKTLALVISCYWSDYNPTSRCLAPPG